MQATDLSESAELLLCDGVPDQPGAAGVPAGLHRGPWALGGAAAEGEAEVSVEHHLVDLPLGNTASTRFVPLVFVVIAAHGLEWPPTLLYHGDVVVVVEQAAVLSVTPPAVIPRILRPGTAQGVNTHECCCTSPGQPHGVHEGCLHGVAAILWVGEAVSRTVTCLRCFTSKFELTLEVDLGRPPVLVQNTLPGGSHHSLCRNDEEVGERHRLAEVLVDILKRLPMLTGNQARLQAVVVAVTHVCAGIRAALPLGGVVVHEIVTGHAQDAPSPVGLLAVVFVAGVAQGVQRLGHLVSDLVVRVS
mmetsp:Transcript_34986/g.79062  ORF Transcript_34986/g.79062 Transcript_34986/m.79062 type:complete len:303 (-) Transcript_34986:648-1556(-)